MAVTQEMVETATRAYLMSLRKKFLGSDASLLEPIQLYPNDPGKAEIMASAMEDMRAALEAVFVEKPST